MGERIVVGSHAINGIYGAQRAGKVIGTSVAHHAHGADGQNGNKGLPDFVIKPVFADLVNVDGIRLAQDGQFLTGDFAGATDCKAGAGEGPSFQADPQRCDAT